MDREDFDSQFFWNISDQIDLIELVLDSPPLL
jgi:hypothetical protein